MKLWSNPERRKIQQCVVYKNDMDHFAENAEKHFVWIIKKLYEANITIVKVTDKGFGSLPAPRCLLLFLLSIKNISWVLLHMIRTEQRQLEI